MSTLIFAVIIFGTAGAVVVSRIKKGRDCGCGECHTACPVKMEIQK
jgi:hypothetical protein